MKLEITESRGGGYHEAWGHLQKIGDKMPNGEIWLCDASTPVPNCRPAELFFAIWGAYQFPTAKIVTDVASSGAVLQNNNEMSYWSIQTDRETLSLVSKSRLQSNESLRKARAEKISQIAMLLGGELGEIPISNIVIENGADHLNLSFWEAVRMVPSGTALGKIPCLPCSFEERRPVEHAVRFEGKMLTLTKSKLPKSTKCLGEKRFRDLANTTPLVSDLATHHGFVPSGKLFYATSRNKQTENRSFVVRDYSNPRGTVASAMSIWAPNAFVSTRFYIKTKGIIGSADTDLNRFIELIAENPSFFASVIREHSILSTGQVITLIDD